MHRNCYTLLHGRQSIVDRALQQSSVYSQLFAQNREFVPTPPAFDAPVKGIPVGILPYGSICKNYVWLPDGEKKSEDTITRFDRMYERDKQTDRQTPHDGIGRAYA